MGDETLLDDSRRFERLAQATGLDIAVDVYPEMQHRFHFMAGRRAVLDADQNVVPRSRLR